MRAFHDLAGFFSQQIHAAEGESAKVYEPVIGIVTDNKDPQKLGRVKVKYPVMLKDETAFWAPIIMLGAGKNRGWFFIPEPNDEVLVMFEHGDLNKPLIVGALWTGKDKPADKNPGGVPRRVIKSRQGSKITFDDEGKKLIVEDGTGKGKITFDAGANKIIIEALDGDVCFSAPDGEVKIVAKSMSVEAKTDFAVHAGSTMQWGIGGTAKINGANVTIAGSKGNANCGVAQKPTAPSATPEDVKDPYGS